MIPKSIGWLTGCVVCLYIFFPLYARYNKRESSQNSSILQIVQVPLTVDSLPTSYLSTVLELTSASSPSKCNLEKSEQILKSVPFIAYACVKIVNNDLYIEYALRSPKALLASWKNSAVDREGVIFPLSPFFSPKQLPQVLLPSSSLHYGDKIDSKEWEIASFIIEAWNSLPIKLLVVDTKKACTPSLGRREIVLTIETEEKKKRYLRLNPAHFLLDIERYKKMHATLLPDIQVVDMRLSPYAYLSKNS